MSITLNNKFIIYIFFILAFLERTVFDLGPNIELVTLAMLASSVYLSRNSALKLTFLLMASTDLFIGNTRIFIFTWSGFLIPVLIISKLNNSLKIENHKLKIIAPVLMGSASNIFFYLWTNFGVWFLDSWNMYPKSIPGLIQCYFNGLPFLKSQLASTFVFIPLGFFLIRYFRQIIIIKNPLASLPYLFKKS